MLTQAEAVTQTRDALREASAREWSDEQLRTWINDAVRDMSRIAEYRETTNTLAIVAGTQTYSLAAISPAISRIHRVEFVPAGETTVIPLEYEDYSNLDSVWGNSKTLARARPSVWTAWGVSPAISFLLYPKPSSNGVVTFYYYAISNKLSITGSAAATALDIPDGWDDLVIHYTEYRALRRDRDSRWQEAKQLYDDGMTHMINMTSRHSDQEGRIVPSGYGGVPGWLAGGGDYY